MSLWLNRGIKGGWRLGLKRFKYTNLFKDLGSKRAVLILQGGNFGVDTDFIQSVFHESVGRGFTTLAYNFPYYDRGESSTSEGCEEEVNTVHEAIQYLLSTGADEVLIVAKSVGSVVVAKLLKESADIPISSIVILGVPLKFVDIKDFIGQKVQIIQGDLDKFGDSQKVKDAASKAGVEIEVVSIPDADHSFRDSDGNEPGQQLLAIQAIDWGTK